MTICSDTVIVTPAATAATMLRKNTQPTSVTSPVSWFAVC